MPTSVKELFSKAGIEIAGQAIWGQTVEHDHPGAYVVTLSNSANQLVCRNEAPISRAAVQQWIQNVPKLRLDGNIPAVDTLTSRLNRFWLPDETIVYIGKAGTSLKKRVGQYYRTPLGVSRPHRGGHWIKTLDNLSSLNIYWALTNKNGAVELENRFIKIFMENVSEESGERLFSFGYILPFANLRDPNGTVKKHGIKPQTN